MRKMMNILVLFVATSNVSLAWAYDGTTHSRINEEAAAESVSQLSSILKNQLGVDEGIQYFLNKNEKEKGSSLPLTVARSI